MSAAQGARVTLLNVLKRVAPHVSVLKLGGLCKELEGVLKCPPIEGVSLSESDSTFQFLLQQTCCWLEQQNPVLDNERDHRKIVRDVKGCLQRWLGDADLQPHGNSDYEKATAPQSSSLPSTRQASLVQMQHLKKDAVEDKQQQEGEDTLAPTAVLKSGSKLQGAIVRIRVQDILVKPIATNAETGSDSQKEFTILKRNLNIGEFEVKLNAGDVVSFKVSERNQKFGYAADLVRLKNMESRDVDKFVCQLEELSKKSPRETLLFVSSCRAVWTYVCDMPVHGHTGIERILRVVANMSRHTVSSAEARFARFMKSLADSRFSATVIQSYAKRHVTSPYSKEAGLIQTFILAIVRYVPERSPRVLPLLGKLTSSFTVKHSPVSSGMNSHESTELCHFFLSVVRQLVLAIPGTTEDVNSLSWDQLPLVPTTQELFDKNCGDLRLLPSVLVDREYESEDDYLDTYFRLLRADCFYNLRTGVKNFVSGELDQRDMAVYRISLDGVQMTNMGIALSIHFRPLGRKEVNWKYSNLLMFGNLVCLAINGTFKEPVWAMVVHRTPELLEEGIVFLSLSSEHNRQSDAEILLALQNCQAAIMAESPTYYRAYGPVFRCLQDKRDGIPFREELVQLSSGNPPSYLDEAMVDWSLIFDKRQVQLHCNSLADSSYRLEVGWVQDRWPVHFFEKLVQRRVTTTLDETQLSSIRTFLQNRITLIQGPPGTGKSYIGVKIVQLLLSMPSRPSGPILVLTYKNHALDQFLEDCLEFCSDVVRVGGRSTNEALREKNIHELKRSTFIPDDLRRELRDTRRELDELKSAFSSVMQQLKKSRLFDLDLFVEVATISQISRMCESCPSEDAESVRKSLKTTRAIIDRRIGAKQALIVNADSRAALSTLLRAWAPGSEIFSTLVTTRRGPSPWNSIVGVEGKNSASENPGHRHDDEEDTENVYEERMVGQDIAGLKAGQWRDPQQGFVSMKHVKPSGITFSLSIPYLPEYEEDRELTTVNNLWDLTLEQRARLILVWMARSTEEDVHTEVGDFVDRQSQKLSELNELEAQVNATVIEHASVVGMTTTGAAINAALINMISPKIIIVEEAAEILEAQLLAVLPTDAQHLIMIGDHQQLRPQVQCDVLKRSHKMDVSMFERLIKRLPHNQLGYQCRMREEFVELIRPLYPSLGTHHELVKQNTAPSCIATSMFFWTHTNHEQQSEHSRSWKNPEEVRRIIQVVQWLLQYGYETKKITILTSYKGQLLEIRSKLKQLKIEGTVTSTIDRYQGDENDIVLVSLVRTSKLGFLAEPNRMCVAASRARCGVYFFGNAVLLGSGCCWKDLISHMKSNKLCSTSFPFVCPVHVGSRVGRDGCTLICNGLISTCGHVCQSLCHGQKAHPQCKQTVKFKFPCGHISSRKCYQKEKDLYCQQTVSETHAACGHVFTRKCFRSPSEFTCDLRCERLLSCGHPCPLKCSEDCSAAVSGCTMCAEQRKIEMKRQQEENRRKVELLRREREESLKRLKQKPTSIRIVSRLQADLWSDMQHQVSQFLPTVGRSSVIVSVISEINNSRLLESWLTARLAIQDGGMVLYRFKLVPDKDSDHIARTGLTAFAQKDWNFTAQSLIPLTQLDSRFTLVRFAVLQVKPRRRRAVQQSCNTEEAQEYDTDDIRLASADQALPDYIVHCEVRDTGFSGDGYLGMTLQEGYFDQRVLKRSETVRSGGSDRLDDLLFREAESQFLRMLPVDKKARVVQVEHIDNGDLNLLYTKKRRDLMSAHGDCQEIFVFHGTNESAISKIVREGFKVGGDGIEIRNGAVYGKGVYTVQDPAFAMRYSRRGGSSKVILCRVVCGQKGTDYEEGGRSDIFVIKAKQQLLPQYVVQYEMVPVA